MPPPTPHPSDAPRHGEPSGAPGAPGASASASASASVAAASADPLPGSSSVLFSNAPAPAPEATENVTPDRPWFLPEAGVQRELLEAMTSPEQDPAAAAAAFARIPLVKNAVHLLEFVGEGREITSDGALPLADLRLLAEQGLIDLGTPEPTTMWQLAAIAGAWNTLIAGQWLEPAGTRVRPGQGRVPAIAEQEDPVGFVHFARALVTLLLLDALQQGPHDGGLGGGPDTFTALLHTLEPGGLRLPEQIRDAIDRDQVPRMPDGDLDMDEVERFWLTQRDLLTLATYGLLQQENAEDGEGTWFRGTAEVVVEAFGVLEVLSELEGQA